MAKKERTPNDQSSDVQNPTSKEYALDKENTAKQVREEKTSKKSK